MSRLGHGFSETLSGALLGAAFDVLPQAAAIVGAPGQPRLLSANRAFGDLLGGRRTRSPTGRWPTCACWPNPPT